VKSNRLLSGPKDALFPWKILHKISPHLTARSCFKFEQHISPPPQIYLLKSWRVSWSGKCVIYYFKITYETSSFTKTDWSNVRPSATDNTRKQRRTHRGRQGQRFGGHTASIFGVESVCFTETSVPVQVHMAEQERRQNIDK
jgi:hypothetical protein